MCLCHIFCPSEPGRNNWENLRSVIPEVPHSPSYPCTAPLRACHCLPLQHTRLSSHQRQGNLLPCNSTRMQGLLCIPPSSGDAGNLPLLYHAPSWTMAWHTSPSPPARGSPPALLTLLHLTPSFFCLLFSLGHFWLLLLGTA